MKHFFQAGNLALSKEKEENEIRFLVNRQGLATTNGLKMQETEVLQDDEIFAKTEGYTKVNGLQNYL